MQKGLSGILVALFSSATLFGVTSAVYATDCTTSFDQSCLSGAYSGEQVEADHKRRQESLEAEEERRAEEAKAWEEAMRQQAEAIRQAEQEAKQERRHKEMVRAIRGRNADINADINDLRRKVDRLRFELE
jgi:Skp family chaperone for outer membrane proteins